MNRNTELTGLAAAQAAFRARFDHTAGRVIHPAHRAATYKPELTGLEAAKASFRSRFDPTTGKTAVRARLAPSGTLPSTIEWMPGGRHSISALGWAGIVDCRPEDAARLDAQLQRARQRAALGLGSRPFIDFDHAGEDAAALPLRFFWDNGIRLELEWTARGAEAVKGREYSYFSPEFYVGDDGRPVGIPEIGPIGGLTNTPAFQRIKTIAARRSLN